MPAHHGGGGGTCEVLQQHIIYGSTSQEERKESNGHGHGRLADDVQRFFVLRVYGIWRILQEHIDRSIDRLRERKQNTVDVS